MPESSLQSEAIGFMKKIILFALLLLLAISSAASAEKKPSTAGASLVGRVAEGASVAVTDFGIHEGAATSDIAILNVGKAAGSYVIERLVDSGHFNVMERESAQARFEEKALGIQGLTQAENYYARVDKAVLMDNEKLTGLIDPVTAQQIGQLLGASYLVYGNVNDVTVSDTGTSLGVGGVTVGTTKAHVIVRMMDVSTGDIVMAAKGEGSSKTSYVKAGAPTIGYISIGTKKVTQDSVHNAVQKAAYQAIDIMVERLYGKAGKKPKKGGAEEE